MHNLTTNVNGTRIREARLRADMSRADLANAIQTSERNIARWESGQNQPRVAWVARIADATGHDIDYFLAESEVGDDDETARSMSSLDDFLRLHIKTLVREEMAKA